ncbi:MAG: hypothetical protein FWD58_00260 [Firmicutes bacterium]|nr:hypothetical protein [Bacillota bacterium]
MKIIKKHWLRILAIALPFIMICFNIAATGILTDGFYLRPTANKAFFIAMIGEVIFAFVIGLLLWLFSLLLDKNKKN